MLVSIQSSMNWRHYFLFFVVLHCRSAGIHQLRENSVQVGVAGSAHPFPRCFAASNEPAGVLRVDPHRAARPKHHLRDQIFYGRPSPSLAVLPRPADDRDLQKNHIILLESSPEFLHPLQQDDVCCSDVQSMEVQL